MRSLIVDGCSIGRIARGVIFSVSLCLAGSALGQTAQSDAPPSDMGELGWSYPSATPLRVHVVRGYSFRQYRMEEALAHVGANFFTESTQSDRGTSSWGTSSPDAGWLRRFPDAAGQAMNHHLIVVGAVGATSFGKNQQILVDFVRHGGSVLFLCDSSTLGSQSAKSPFAEMVPLEFPAEGPWRLETEQPDEPVELKAGPDAAVKKLPSVESGSPPLVFSYYKVKPKPGAKVLLLADEDPVLILGEFGRGKVAVFAATCRGYARDGQLAYWEWDAWPGLLADTLQ
ncbi:MAG: glutamine amidotransferase [Thermoguttaceae bacterium]